MKVVEIIDRSTKPLISFEIIPPQRGGDLMGLQQVLEDIAAYEPPFIDITSHSAEIIYEETRDGIKKRIVRKRPGTLGICALIQHKFNIEAVPHLLCRNFTREETEDFLIELNYLGINNVLAIQGDNMGFQKQVPAGRSANRYASELVEQIADMNKGKFLSENLVDGVPSDFCIGVSGYPEKHFESPNLETDVTYTKGKIDAGADYIVTQMFFTNEHFFAYEKKLREAGIAVPVIPGLKIITNKRHLQNLPRFFHIDLPYDLTQEIEEAKPEHVLEIGVEWAAKQAEELMNSGSPVIHFYIMQNSKPVKMLMKRLGY